MQSNYVNSGLQGLGDYSPGQRTLRNTGKPYMSGADVRYVQQKVGVNVDGKYGPQTQAGVMHFQSQHGLNATGIVDAATWNALQQDTGSILSAKTTHLLDWLTGHTEGMGPIDQLFSPANYDIDSDTGGQPNHPKKWMWYAGGGIIVLGVLGIVAGSAHDSEK